MSRQPEPFCPPPYEASKVERTKWYCLHCVQFRSTEAELTNHVEVMHLVRNTDAKSEPGVDHVSGWVLYNMMERHAVWVIGEMKRYDMLLDACLGSDDILLEIDNGAELNPYS